MTINKKQSWLRNAAAFCLMVTVFVSTSMIALAKTGNSMAGEIIVSGRSTNGVEPLVTLNGERAFSGRTFFESGVITTSETASATIKLGKLGYINLAPNSAMSLSFNENTISGKIISGDVKVFNNAGVTVNVENLPAAAQKDDDDDDDDNSYLVPLLIFSAAVGAAVVYVMTNDSDDGSIVSPAR
jgi:hypothetical protein